MFVQTFLEEEKADLVVEPEEWMEKVKALGLTGQESLVSKGQASPIPFKHMDAEMHAIYEVLCPSKTDIKNYSKEPIPLKCLSMVTLAVEKEWFNNIMVWYHPQKPDPIIVGYKTNPERSWENDCYILAQWGPENLSPEQLKERAIALWKEAAKAKLEIAMEKAKSQLVTLDSLASKYFRGESVQLVEPGY